MINSHARPFGFLFFPQFYLIIVNCLLFSLSERIVIFVRPRRGNTSATGPSAYNVVQSYIVFRYVT